MFFSIFLFITTILIVSIVRKFIQNKKKKKLQQQSGTTMYGQVFNHPNFFLTPHKEKVDVSNLDENEIITRTYIPGEFATTQFDTVVVGAGISGLITAEILQESGRSVLLIDQNEKLGGMTHSFTEQGYEFSAGVHFIGKLVDGDMFKLILDKVSGGELLFTDFQDNIIDTTIIDGKKYPFYGGEDRVEKLVEMFPEDKKAIKRIFEEMKKTYHNMVPYIVSTYYPRHIAKYMELKSYFNGTYHFFKYLKIKWKDYVRKNFRNKHLKMMFLRRAGSIGGETTATSGVFTMLNSYAKGSMFPKNGSSDFGKKITKTFIKYGGEARCNARVSNILVENSKVKGVRLTNGDEIFCDNIVSTVGFLNTNMLLPKKIRLKEIDRIEPSVCHFITFIGIDCDFKTLDIPYGVVNILNTKNQSESKWLESSGKPFIPTSLGICHHNGVYGKEGKTTLTLIIRVNNEWFSKFDDESLRVKQRGNEYNELKLYFENNMLNWLFENFPKVEKAMEENKHYIESATPLTVKHYCSSHWGESYGMKYTQDRLKYQMKIKKILKKEVKGLFMSGADNGVSAGVGGAMHGAICGLGPIMGRNMEIETMIALRTKMMEKKEK